jgi:hypothetical protein
MCRHIVQETNLSCRALDDYAMSALLCVSIKNNIQTIISLVICYINLQTVLLLQFLLKLELVNSYVNKV